MLSLGQTSSCWRACVCQQALTVKGLASTQPRLNVLQLLLLSLQKCQKWRRDAPFRASNNIHDSLLISQPWEIHVRFITFLKATCSSLTNIQACFTFQAQGHSPVTLNSWWPPVTGEVSSGLRHISLRCLRCHRYLRRAHS